MSRKPLYLILLLTLLLALIDTTGFAQKKKPTDKPKAKNAQQQKKNQKKNQRPDLKKNQKKDAKGPKKEILATSPSDMVVKEGFKVELLHSVPQETQGSWVNMCVDHKGRLIVSDQYGKLYRVKPYSSQQAAEATIIEEIDLEIGQAQGLLYAFDSLYVMVANKAYDGQGLYRIRDTDGDDKFDEVKLLRNLEGRGEHGPHAILLGPDRKSLYIVCGNSTKLTDIDSSRVPRVWDEDLLLPRIYGRGFMKGVPAPGGWIAKTDPEGKKWELISTGFRNEFDAAFNLAGDLFTFDADMEWDMNTPWYRPTRVCLVNSGAEYGWRNGSGKWPSYYEDSMEPVVNIGPGSPTGVTFGYGARFPMKYQNAFFICDWSWGILYAVHMTPKGAGYSATFEKFITGTPLPLTDIVVNPHDGAMYFLIGGRKTKSGLYRVTYAGSESTDPIMTPIITDSFGTKEWRIRKQLEELHTEEGRKTPNALGMIGPHLGSEDRLVRYAARIAFEHQYTKKLAMVMHLKEKPMKTLMILMAVCRHGEKMHQSHIFRVLGKLSWDELNEQEKITWLRVHALACARFGEPSSEMIQTLIQRLNPLFPANSHPLNSELCQLLVYLQCEETAKKGVKLLEAAPTQEEQIDYAKSLRLLKRGWTKELRERYFAWFLKAASYRGGASFGKFVDYIRQDAVALLSAEEKESLKEILNKKPEITVPKINPNNRPIVKKWTVEELAPLFEGKLRGRDFNRGRTLFAEANCFSCHRFDNRGGAIGPDLTSLAGRFSKRDLLVSVIDPSKEISDQYEAVQIVTMDGKQVIGRIINLAGDTYRINTNMLDPNAITIVDRTQIDIIQPSKSSMMPAGLLDILKKDEILDLMAYLLSRGDRNDPMFQK